MLVTNYTVTAIGILSSGLQVALNIHIVYKYLIPSPAWKKHDFRFIIFRTFIDILQGFAGVAYFSSIIPYVLRPDLFSFNYLFVSGLILTNITIVRSFLAAGIAIERCFNYGPVTGVLRTVGRLFEALVMYKLMKPKITSPKSNSMHLKIPQQERTSMRF
ncbi:unnamed protein product [Caenorhabditis angaria]|uniref:Uncharacterized protein n=1 Tax=Caenorhabditis angaria TaxID=860376 RepID=A0A9P1I801_9PELO|nr:unnamed protein product [Caenorhabditis angaria]